MRGTRGEAWVATAGAYATRSAAWSEPSNRSVAPRAWGRPMDAAAAPAGVVHGRASSSSSLLIVEGDDAQPVVFGPRRGNGEGRSARARSFDGILPEMSMASARSSGGASRPAGAPLCGEVGDE